MLLRTRTGLRRLPPFLPALAAPLPAPCPACQHSLSTRSIASSSTRQLPALESNGSPSSALDLPPVAVQLQPTAGPSSPKTAPPPKSRIPRARKAALQLSPEAVERLRSLNTSPTPQLIRVGVRNKGCAGMSYHLDYVSKPDKFDEVVEQDGVKVVIDSKALFSIIGSVMDWKEDALGAKFVFKNPNIKDACGCGESFIV